MIASNLYMAVFRIAHILAGIVWVGSAFLFVFYLQPSAAAVGPAGAPFMAELLGKRRLTDGILMAGATAVVAGLFIYWHDWQLYGSFSDWIGSTFGLVLTVGALASIVALAIGVFGTRPNVRRLLILGRQVAESGGPPSPEIGAEIGQIQGRLKVFARVGLALLVFAVLAMSTARYL